MTKALYAIALAILSVTLLLMWCTSTANADTEPDGPNAPLGAIRMAARDAFVCPGMHAEWLDDHTIQCLREKP
ncbi:hypothetical protein [Comamonas sp. 26]|uniref:hypothetical protein n=1 Tax=Comamonas sp. 26 TaxID=2035201 RepID=UPI000C18B4DD|nr:hypothetical protein [Comamonas sp. 26]PIG09493.1 hypothetical protein CLU84_2404 [Comamonas sp. 26]